MTYLYFSWFRHTLLAPALLLLLVPTGKAGEPVRLTRDGRFKSDPVIVGGGEEPLLVWTQQESAAQLVLMQQKLSGGAPERLHPAATTTEFEPSFTPDGRLYAFVRSQANLNLKLILRDARQNREAVFDPGGGFAGMHHPTFAPDGSRVVFSIPASTGQELASVDAQGKNRKSLTRVGLNSWPAFSPDGKQLAFGSSRAGDYELYVMNADGSNLRRLTHSVGFDARPAWSPDGKRLAFTSNRDGNYEVYVMNADGSRVQRLTHHPERDDYPTWHPDGKHLVLVCERDGKFDLYQVEVPAGKE